MESIYTSLASKFQCFLLGVMHCPLRTPIGTLCLRMMSMSLWPIGKQNLWKNHSLKVTLASSLCFQALNFTQVSLQLSKPVLILTTPTYQQAFNSHVLDQWLHVQTNKASEWEIQLLLKFLTISSAFTPGFQQTTHQSGTLLENLEITIHSANDNYNLTVEHHTMVKKMTLRSRGCYGIR